MEIKKALTFRASSIGDCLMGKYFLENIHVAYPGSRCAIIVGSRGAMIRDLFAAYPWLEVIEVNRRNPVSVLRLLWLWRGSDIVLTQYAGKIGGRFSLASKFVARLLASRGSLIGFTDTSSWNRYLYDKILIFEKNIAPAVLERQALIELSVPIAVPTPTLSFLPQEAVLKRIAVAPGRYMVVHLFASNMGRGLSPENRRVLVNNLHAQFPSMILLISGGKQDRVQAEEVASGIPNVYVIAGDASLQDMMQIISSATGVISVDTGIAHMAAQLHKPLVVLASCLGLHWWKEEQYGKNEFFKLFTHVEPGGHTFKDYPDCINEIDMKDSSRAVATLIPS